MTCACADDEHRGLVAYRGRPVALLGEIRRIGMAAPDFTALDADFRPVRLSDFRGQKILVNSFPGLDLPESGKALDELAESANAVRGVRLIAVGMDLPFALSRHKRPDGGILPLSDHMEGNFGMAFGLLMREYRLLARAVLAIDEAGRLVHQEIAPDAGGGVDIDAALGILAE